MCIFTVIHTPEHCVQVIFKLILRSTVVRVYRYKDMQCLNLESLTTTCGWSGVSPRDSLVSSHHKAGRHCLREIFLNIQHKKPIK